MLLLALIIGAGISAGTAALPGEPLPVVRVTADDTVIDRSCRIEIEPGAVIRDVNGDGVIHIRASNITVEFAPGSILRGTGPREDGETPDAYAGIGIRIDGQSDVTLRWARVQGFKAGVWATRADGLLLEDCRADDLWRMHLRSTPAAEDSSDWLWPHRNDDNEWLTNYGAAFYIEDSQGVTVRRCAVRRGQNGLVLDRASGARVYDNDFSFLSGWGLAMWRSSGNTISRNALDFCVRGYSHGVYNRGQDSAGILMFEQCSDNIIAENSATHGGDGFFGFAGREALGEAPPPEGFDHTRKGCNDNLLIENDFSYAPAHGIEMTFSFGNRFVRNRLVENAICGVWGGYSQDTVIYENVIERNGLPGRVEGGGINIEHGRGNIIHSNAFAENTVGVSLWWDNDEGIFKTPWAKANHRGSVDTTIAANTFLSDAVAVWLRDTQGTILARNVLSEVGEEVRAVKSPYRLEDDPPDPPPVGEYRVLGASSPVGARHHLRGRDKIIMGPWGPWDHEEPMVRPGAGDGAGRVYELFGGTPGAWTAEDLTTGERRAWPDAATADRPLRLTIAPQGDVHPYALRLRNGDWSEEVRGTIVAATWRAMFFTWTPETDPREDLAAWRALAASESAAEAPPLPELRLRYGNRGPRHQPWATNDLRDRLPGPDRFGMIATATITLPKGRYRLTTLSDDGVRVIVAPAGNPAEARTVIENWTWHAPTRDTGEWVQEEDGPVTLTVEHFEIDGHAVLEFGIEVID